MGQKHVNPRGTVQVKGLILAKNRAFCELILTDAM